MKELTLITFRVTDKYFGYPDPYIANGSYVILIRDNIIKVGKYEEPSAENPIPTFIFPINNIDVDRLAIDLITQNSSNYLNQEDDVVLTCPSYISNKVIW